MARFEIQPLRASSIHEVAKFLHKNAGEDPVSMERRLNWLLVENPLATEDSPLGLCIREDSGAMKGLLLSFPSSFVIGDRRLLALGSGGFFVETEARTMGFYLFKKYLGFRNYDFYFSSTCNSNSAPVWRALGGCAIPHSELEYILPLRLQALLPELLSKKSSRKFLLATASILGECGDRIARFFSEPAAGVAIEPCRDWQKLSWLFHRCRSNNSITTDRSPEFLEWRYGRNSDPYPSGVYLFHDKRGVEGWFALGSAMRGGQRRIRGSILLDAVWPRERISGKEILSEIVRLVAPESDALSLRPRPEFDCGECSRWMLRRRGGAPAVFLIDRTGDSQMTAAALDLSWADGDSAPPIAPLLRSEVEHGSKGDELNGEGGGRAYADQRCFF